MCDGGNWTKKESPVEVSEKAYLESIPEERGKSKGGKGDSYSHKVVCLST
jgi:hypothetical protein